MERRVAAAGAGAVVVIAALVLAAAAGRGAPLPTEPPGRTVSPSALSGPTGTPSPYTFDDEFDGSSLAEVWQRHFHCCGDLAGFDPSLTSVANGQLVMRVAHRAGGWYGDLIDTKATRTQLYGYFEARIKVPSGTGLWPAFWSYFAGGGTTAEIDTMEVCPGPSPGSQVLHNSVFWSPRSRLSHEMPPVDLSGAFHVYAVDWRRDAITFYLDGQETWTFTDVARIPDVPLPLILDLGVGGEFCGPPDATTPDGSQMLVDWVRVRA